MARLRTNLTANIVGAGWTAAVQFAAVPLFIHFLGIEAFGLIGFFLTIQVTIQGLDFGVGATVNRELARYSTLPRKAAQARDLVRTLEASYWLLGIGIGTFLFLLGPRIATLWLDTGALSTTLVQDSIELMGLIIAVQWPVTFYQSGLMGLQRLVSLNVVRVLAVSISTGGAVLVVAVSPSVNGFFAWQLISSAVHVAVLSTVLWRAMPTAGRRSRFDFALIREVLPFLKGMSGIVILGTVLANMDRIVLSKLVSLEEFGYYTVAAMLAGGLQLFITPIYSSVFPRLSALVMTNDTQAVRHLYHVATQLTSICLLATAAVLGTWAAECLTLWTGNPVVAAQAAPVAVLLLIGTSINGLMHLPYALQLAHGWTSLNLKLSALQLLLFAPMLLWTVQHYGAIGAAATWVALNATYLVAGLGLMHQRLLPSDLMTWLLKDVGRPLLAIAAVVLIARYTLSWESASPIVAVQLIGVGVASVAFASIFSPLIREHLLAHRMRPSLWLDGPRSL